MYPDAGLENASQLLTNVFHSKTAGIIFGIALLASGQSSTLTGTYAGKISRLVDGISCLIKFQVNLLWRDFWT